jgi:hypothetical protein
MEGGHARLRLIMSSCGWFPLGPREIRAWLERHPEALPHKLADLARFPVPFRSIMVNAVAPDVRVALWREHLESFLGDSSLLTETQQSFILQTIPELSDILATPAPNPVIVEWERRMAAVFAREDAARIFGLIGPPEPPEGIPLPPDALPSSAQ